MQSLRFHVNTFRLSKYKTEIEFIEVIKYISETSKLGSQSQRCLLYFCTLDVSMSSNLFMLFSTIINIPIKMARLKRFLIGTFQWPVKSESSLGVDNYAKCYLIALQSKLCSIQKALTEIDTTPTIFFPTSTYHLIQISGAFQDSSPPSSNAWLILYVTNSCTWYSRCSWPCPQTSGTPWWCCSSAPPPPAPSPACTCSCHTWLCPGHPAHSQWCTVNVTITVCTVIIHETLCRFTGLCTFLPSLVVLSY